jgi:hypothetical protein
MDTPNTMDIPSTLDQLKALLSTIDPSPDLDVILRKALEPKKLRQKRAMSSRHDRFYTCDEIADEVHYGVTKVRAWFTKNRGGCMVDGHGEKLHKKKHVNIRISPAARQGFMKAHGLRSVQSQQMVPQQRLPTWGASPIAAEIAEKLQKKKRA